MERDNGLYFLLGASFTLSVVTMVSEHRHKRQLHRRINYAVKKLKSLGEAVQGVDQRLAEVRRWKSSLDPSNWSRPNDEAQTRTEIQRGAA